MTLNSSWFVFHFKKLSVLLISKVVSAMVLSQNWTMSFVNDKENFFNLEYQLSNKIWSWLPIVGSIPVGPIASIAVPLVLDLH